MNVVSNGTTLQVTFDSPLAFQGAEDVVRYAIGNSVGAVPVAVQGVTLRYTIVQSGVGFVGKHPGDTVAGMGGSSSFSATLTSVPGAVLAGGSSLIAAPTVRKEVQVTMAGDSSMIGFHAPTARIHGGSTLTASPTYAPGPFTRLFFPFGSTSEIEIGDFISLQSAWNQVQFAQVMTVYSDGTIALDQDLFRADPQNGAIAWSHTRGLEGVDLTINKPHNGSAYTLTVSGLRTLAGQPFTDSQSFTAVIAGPRVISAEQLDEGQILIMFSGAMRLDSDLVDPEQYVVTGPSAVLVKTVQTVSPTQVLITTVGMDTGSYSLTVNATGTPHDVAGNPLDPLFNQAVFTGSPALSSRSVFVDRGPITKPPLTLQSGATATITNATTLTMPTASVAPSMVGLYITLTGSAINAGTFKITARLSATSIHVVASFSLPDPANGTIGWTIFDPRNGVIADDPTDVVVRVNSIPVIADSVIGLLGQIVLPSVPSPTDTVDVDYAWVCNPVVDFRRLNSKEFRLNNWNRDNGRPTDVGQHKYRYNNTLVQPDTFVPLDLRADIPQPLERDLKYRAYERAYTAVLNDPNLLLLNSPTHRIAFPPLSRAVSSTFVNYQATVLPDSDPVAPWERHGSGSATLVVNQLVVVDSSTGPFPGGEPIFWSRSIDLTFPHVFATAWRMMIDAVPTLDGVYTGIASGYADNEKAVIVGYLDDGGVKKIGILKAGSGNDTSMLSSWIGGFDTLGNPTNAPIELDWSVLHSYRIFRDRDGVIRFYVDGSIVEVLRVLPNEIPYLEELNAPFDELQGVFFGSLSREAENTSTWSFVRYTAIPINPFQSDPAVFVSYEATTSPESASQPWTPVGFHGTETIISSDFLLLDSTSATDASSETAAGLISGDFKGFFRIEPLLSVSPDTVLDVNVALRTFTHGITPNAVMAAIDDSNRLIQLCFFPDQSAPKFSYGGRALPNQFSPYMWNPLGGASSSMVGQFLRITDASTTDGLVYFLDDVDPVAATTRVVSPTSDYDLEFRVHVISYVADVVGYTGVMAQAYDSLRSVGLLFQEILGQRYVTFHSDGTPIVGGQFAFDWFDGAFHTYRASKSTGGDLVSLFIDGIFIGSVAYSAFAVPAPSPTGVVSFGSSTPLSVQSQSTVDWAYANFWRVNSGFRKFVGLWKGYDPTALTGYHLPLKIFGRGAALNGNVLTDLNTDFTADGVNVGDQLIIDAGPNKGVYTVTTVAPAGDVQKVVISSPFPLNPSVADYRIVDETDWTVPHRYRILKDPSGGISVSLDSNPPMILVGYNNIDLPSSAVGVPRAIAGGLASISWGAFDPSNISQTSWDFVRFGATRTQSELGIVPHHQILNQRNVMASYEHHKTLIPHAHTDFWSESEGIPPQNDPDFLRDPNLIAFTLLNEQTPLVPETQTYEIRRPTPVLVSISGLNRPEDVLNSQAFVLNNGAQELKILVPDDILYNSLQVIERSTGSPDLIAPFDDECQPRDLGTLHFQNTVCLTYDGTVLPENDPNAITPWTRESDDDTHQFESAFAGILTYGTDGIGTRTTYRNNTPLPDSIGLHTEIKFRLKLLQDSTGGLGDSQVRVGFSSPGVTVGLAFVTTLLGERYVLVVDLNNGATVGGIPFDFYDGTYHDYRLVRDPGSAAVQIFIDS